MELMLWEGVGQLRTTVAEYEDRGQGSGVCFKPLAEDSLSWNGRCRCLLLKSGLLRRRGTVWVPAPRDLPAPHKSTNRNGYGRSVERARRVDDPMHGGSC